MTHWVITSMAFFNHGPNSLIEGNINGRGENEKIVTCNHNVNGMKLLPRKVNIHGMNMGGYT